MLLSRNHFISRIALINPVISLENVVKVTRRGQTTIPQRIRRQCGVKEGDRLLVEATVEGILFKPIPNLLDMIGIDVGIATPEQLNKMIDKLREEY